MPRAIEERERAILLCRSSAWPVRTEVCEKCDETFFTEDGWKQIERTAKSKGLWGIGKRVKIGRSGHSLIVRIPSRLAATAHLKRGGMVFVQPAGEGKLLIEREAEE